jgi:hypothetical protein
VVPVTPAPTETPIPLPEGFVLPPGQKTFPSQLEPTRNTRPLPTETVLALWKEYLRDSHVVVEAFSADVHLCADGRIISGSTSNVVEEGYWDIRPSQFDWYQVVLGREFGRRRLATIAVLSRTSGVTVALSDGLVPISVTDSDVCANSSGGA